jgi:hypothetical protein
VQIDRIQLYESSGEMSYHYTEYAQYR